MEGNSQNHKYGKLVTVPNALSFLRILMIPFILYYLSRDDGMIYAVIFSFIGIVTDYFDGFFARKLDQISDSGKIIDPLADKVVVGAVLVGLVLFRDFPLWALILIVLRDVIIFSAGFIIFRRKGYVPESSMLGKWTVTVYAVLVLAYIVDIGILKQYLLYISLVLIFLSLYGYYRSAFARTTGV